MNPAKLTAAHKTLPFGTKVKVTNSRSGKSVVVRINDRGPFIRGRVLDLSKAAAQNIGMVRAGHAKVCYEILG
jgi:rare lipoprotein A